MNAPFGTGADRIIIPIEFRSCFDGQRAAYFAEPEPSYSERLSDLGSLQRLLKENREALVAAINADYGNRSEFETLFAEFFVVLETIKDTAKHLRTWMKPQRRNVDFLTYPGARNRVIPQPVGVVGVIVPWNFPLNLSFAPLTGILAAGNRAMVKMSEKSQRLVTALMEISPRYFPEDKLKFFEDGGGRGPAFSTLISSVHTATSLGPPALVARARKGGQAIHGLVVRGWVLLVLRRFKAFMHHKRIRIGRVGHEPYTINHILDPSARSGLRCRCAVAWNPAPIRCRNGDCLLTRSFGHPVGAFGP